MPLVNDWAAVLAPSYGIGAWLLLATLAVVSTGFLWDRQERGPRVEPVFGLVVLAAAGPALFPPRFPPHPPPPSPLRSPLPLAPALGGGVAGVLVFCSAPLWLRTPLQRLSLVVGIASGPAVKRSMVVRPLLLALTLLPLLVLALSGARMLFGGEHAVGPVPDS